MLVNHWGYEFNEIEGFDLGARNDFTVEELANAVNSGDEVQVDYLHPPTDHDGKGYSKTEVYGPNGRKKYIGYEDRTQPAIGYRVTEPEDFSYEGGQLLGFGTFTNVTSGNLGDGHDAWAVFKHEESGRLFMNTGWYSSHGDSEMGDWTEVEPVEVTVIRYKDVADGQVYEHPVVEIN